MRYPASTSYIWTNYKLSSYLTLIILSLPPTVLVLLVNKEINLFCYVPTSVPTSKERRRKKHTKSSIFSVEENLLCSGAKAVAVVFLSLPSSVCHGRKMLVVVWWMVLFFHDQLESTPQHKSLQFMYKQKDAGCIWLADWMVDDVYKHMVLRTAQKDALSFTCCFVVLLLLFYLHKLRVTSVNQTHAVGQCTM